MNKQEYRVEYRSPLGDTIETIGTIERNGDYFLVGEEITPLMDKQIIHVHKKDIIHIQAIEKED